MKSGLLRTADRLHTAGLVWATCHGVVSLESKAVGPMTIDWSAVYEQAMHMIVKGLS
jgi:hypothetical protein